VFPVVLTDTPNSNLEPCLILVAFVLTTITGFVKNEISAEDVTDPHTPVTVTSYLPAEAASIVAISKLLDVFAIAAPSFVQAYDKVPSPVATTDIVCLVPSQTVLLSKDVPITVGAFRVTSIFAPINKCHSEKFWSEHYQL
jgi:hypothetical protein